MDALSIGELPNDLIEDILAWLPTEYLCRFRSVCNKWNTLFLSTRFIATQWGEAPPNKIPLLMVGVMHYYWECYTYSSFTQRWNTSPLFLPFIAGSTYRNAGLSRGPIRCRFRGSGAGLFLIEDKFNHSINVFNPLTGKRFTLPPMTYGEHFWKGQMGIVQQGEDGYKVAVVRICTSLGRNVVEIYDSTQNAWRIATVLDLNLDLYSHVSKSTGIVFPRLGFFYCLVVSDNLRGMMSFNMREGTYNFVPLPQHSPNVYNRFAHLVNCGSRILLVAGMEIEQAVEVVIWEYQEDDAATKWKEIARMPPTVFAASRHGRFECAAMADCIYFKITARGEVAVCNLTQNLWSMLPYCPCPTVALGIVGPPLVAFTPRLDMLKS